MTKYMLEVTLVFEVEAEDKEQAENLGWGYWRSPGLEEMKIQPDTVYVLDPADFMEKDDGSIG